MKYETVIKLPVRFHNKKCTSKENVQVSDTALLCVHSYAELIFFNARSGSNIEMPVSVLHFIL